ncbi:hypothetical protein DT075_37910 [Bacillus licheniformis]|nr:hypothetical protein DT075_37910 [Bacillus licheniformis]
MGRFSIRKGKIGLLNSMLVGMIFAAGWTPCIGPIFGTIAYANFQNPDFGSAFMMITAYSLGFAIPFLESVMIHAAAFLAGFSVIFYILGFSASSVGLLFLQYHNLIRMLGGIFFVVMGLFLLGVFRPAFMMKEEKENRMVKNI